MATKATNRVNGTPEATPAIPVEKPSLLVQLDTRTIRLRVEGISSLIQHAWSEKAIRMMEEKQQQSGKTTKGRAPKNPEEEFQACFYRDADGRYCIPASSFKNAMVSASTSVDDKRFPKTKIRQALFVEGDLLPIIHQIEPEKRTDTVRLNGTTADIRYRPEFKGWAVDLTITYNAGVVSQDQVVNLLNLAGFAVGVGEWRPEKNGNYGRFRVSLTTPK